ncbi:hypothetical protein GCM10009001_24450 [Virgibacillus siamensis]|uniref:Response regulatory domain-containing protein n=1 Tax=Virgibacillus siamensis TaxID=480071 RepID=A0ABN1G8U5_9BACI
MINVLLVEDERLFREGVRSLLKTEDNINMVGMAEDGKVALA